MGKAVGADSDEGTFGSMVVDTTCSPVVREASCTAALVSTGTTAGELEMAVC